MKNKNSKGITLIALIVTIVVLIILAVISINFVFGDNGIISRAEQASFKHKMAAYKEEANLYATWKISEKGNTDISYINAGEMLKEAIEQEIIMDITRDDVSIDIKEILPGIKKEEEEYIVIYKGELYYVSNDKIDNNANQAKWCEEIGIKILEYTPATGIVVRNGNYELVNGVYLCTPKLDEGFDESRTRYLEVGSNGCLVPGNWIYDKPTNNWYDYKSSKWANIYVENDGAELYYVWIPRYCFILNQETERSDVKFIDIDNTYKDEDGNITKWEDLEKEGYQVPEAFTFNGQEIAGYWAMKYTAGDITKPSTINYDMSVARGKVTIRNITLNTTVNPITKYTVALNGKIIQEITDTTVLENIGTQVIEFSDLRPGNNVINITGLNANGEIVGSMTKEYTPTVVNQPDLSGFDPDTTFYVTYDDNDNEHSTIPISEEVPMFWYEYGESRWANIVTRNNGLETYYVWIPRYQFALDYTNERSIVKFINGTSTEAEEGYQIPEAFTFNGQEITGYWAMKYTAGDAAAPTFDTEVVATSSSIRTKGITGTSVGTGKVYKYYLNGEYKGESTTYTEEFEYTGLESGKKYTVLVEVRNSTTDAHLGSVLKQISTVEANKPELIGFNSENTYYVLYDEDGNETIGDNIKNDGSNMPQGWYDYSKSKWANIMVEANGLKTYYVWIPRYEFKITSSQYMQPAKGRTEVRFLPGTSTETSTGYQIPEAFTFNGQELTGYWAMKYTAGT